ncbi:DUF4229 domain-containing protein [Demequina muriae]|uniref:DUF4229 domain-containing protein n=1 Tax=Demequina muriae TaxID=3051664 RepID=A0ABT8GH31_9MICO|nr:DUF4229 domain-containing protein [Demequina sp. EGI L300058]MDN4480749.1 DUF4229 domain-containing protein [Demequina sp. EGI L300058]
MKVFAYWAARTAIFVAVLAALWLVGWFDVIAVFAAFILAWLISYLALPGMRLAAQQQMAGLIDRSQRGMREADSEEDAEIGEADGSR